jgi:16S rRNA (adenine1518-N6/adenine1519-N6)-dimethyltransferase
MGRVRARKRFGQHFLRDRAVAARIAAMARPQAQQVVLEVGPGAGALTAPLIEAWGRIVAVEIDRDLVALLREMFTPTQLHLIEGDILRLELTGVLEAEGAGRLVVVGNRPYNITAPLLFRLLEQSHCIDRAVVMVQREVAQRLTAGPGGKDYGRITVMLGQRAEVSLSMTVEPRAFRPVPKVHSAVVEIRFLPQPRFPVVDEAVFRRLVRTAFGQRRKMLRNSLAGMLAPLDRQHLPEIAARAGIDLRERPERLALAEFASLSDEFSRFASSATVSDVDQLT